MRKLILLILLVPTAAVAQWQADLYAGLANYQGDLQAKKFSLTPAKPAIGLGLSYLLSPKLSVRGIASYMQLEGGDNLSGGNKGNQFRNLSFRSRILEAQLAVEYHFFDLEYRTVTPYVFGGAGIFQFNPWVKNSAGEKIFLHSLGTEGQGLPQYPDRKEYKLIQFALPFGGGIKTNISQRIQVGVEIGFRKLFTDYLDDVSTTYADSTLLAERNGPLAAEYAYRGDEIAGGGSYPVAGSQRGNPKNKDWYYTTVIRLSYRFGRNENSGGAGNGRSKLGCPSL